jgi:glycosyltransferase involved in cell wall biosynthesis
VKYWLLTSEYPPFFGGGISTYCYFTAQMLVEKGHEVTVFVNDAAVDDHEIIHQAGVRIIRFGTTRTGSLSFLGHVTNISFEFAQITKEFIEREGRPDILEAQEYLGIAYYILQYKYLRYDWCCDLRVLITMHSPSFLYMEYNHVPEYRYPNYWICEMERFCLQSADILISPSRFMVDELAKRFRLNNRNLSIIPNPFSVKMFSAVPVAKTEVTEIVFFGKLTIQKGAFKLLEYFRRLWEEGFDRPLHLLGGQDIVYHPEGKTMGDIIRSRYKTYIDRGLLRMEDRIPPSDIAARLAKAGVVIVPSCNDNLPYVVFEMMALGKVLLVSKQGGQSEVIEEGTTGFIFDHDRPETFGSQLKKILALPDEVKERIGRAAQEKVASFYSQAAIYDRKMAVITSSVAEQSTEFPFIRPLHDTAVRAVPQAGGLISVVVPFYNMGKYIAATIASLAAVEYAEKEILIINDGSTDPHSLEVLQQYRGQPGITVYDTPNRGLAHARNFGASRANGTYLAFLDADDKVHPTYYAKAIRVLGYYGNVHFAAAWTQYFEGSQKIWPTFMPEPPLILYHNLVNSSALVYKRASFLEAGINDRTMIFQGLEDYESVVSMVAGGFPGIALPEPLFQYRVRANSMIRGISRAKKLLLYQHISQKHNEFYGRFAADLFNLLNANGPGGTIDNPTLDYHLADKIPFGGKLAGKMIVWVKKNRYAKKLAYRVYRFINK